MPCLVKCDPSGINANINPINVRVSTKTGINFPDSPNGFVPRDGDRVFLWEIQKHGGTGLTQRGYLYNFRKEEETRDGKAFLLEVRHADKCIQVLTKDNLKNERELTTLQDILKNAHAGVFELTGEQADFIDNEYYLPELVRDVDELRNDRGIDETTRERLIQARLGQGQFRQDIMRRWQGACAATGCTQPEVLRASHIRPWRELTNEERLCPANGILLAANLDALFDRFLISFHDDGHMLISDRVEQSCRELFGLPARLRGGLTAEEKGFLGYHREQLQDEEYRLAAGTTVLPTRVS